MLVCRLVYIRCWRTTDEGCVLTFYWMHTLFLLFTHNYTLGIVGKGEEIWEVCVSDPPGVCPVSVSLWDPPSESWISPLQILTWFGPKIQILHLCWFKYLAVNVDTSWPHRFLIINVCVFRRRSWMGRRWPCLLALCTASWCVPSVWTCWRTPWRPKSVCTASAPTASSPRCDQGEHDPAATDQC